MESKLEDVLQSAGVDPSTASQLVADGWTIATFACSVVDIQDFDKSLDEMLPGHTLTILERSQLCCFQDVLHQIECQGESFR